MRVLVAPAGSRGDFQPLLALALGLRAAGHQVTVCSSPNFAAEVSAFGLPFRAIGFDIEAYARKLDIAASRLRATWELFKVGRAQVVPLIREAVEGARGSEVLVGGGAQIAGPTVAEALGIPYVYVAYTPQALWSARHPPFTMPVHGLPRVCNRMLWNLSSAIIGRGFGGPINRERRSLGLAKVSDWYGHFFPRTRTILAADPEIMPPAPDSPLAMAPAGSWHLPDGRPLGDDIERFLAQGRPPVYIGFGSMPDPQPARTTRLLLDAASAARVRLILSRGWAGYGQKDPGGEVLAIGSVSHALLFPRLAAVVHHGGAGTTAAAARAGKPQVIVPHAFDQFQWGRAVHAAGLGPPPISRPRLTARRLAEAIGVVLGDAGCAERAREVGAQVRSRDSIAAGVAAVEALAKQA